MRTPLCLLGFFVFSFFSYLQWNDITQYKTQQIICYLWVASYALLALLSLLCGFKQLSPKLFWLFAAIPFILSIFRFPYIDWSYGRVLHNPDSPAANETGGLIIMAIWAIILGILNKKKLSC